MTSKSESKPKNGKAPRLVTWIDNSMEVRDFPRRVRKVRSGATRTHTTGDFPMLDVRHLYRDKRLVVGTEGRCTFKYGEEAAGELTMTVTGEPCEWFHPGDKPTALELVYTLPDHPEPFTARLGIEVLSWVVNGKYSRHRSWFMFFVCNGSDTPHRCIHAYLMPEGARCRKCSDLNLAIWRNGPRYRADRKAHRLRKKLGWDADSPAITQSKPPGMTWATFERLLNEYFAAVTESTNRWNEKASKDLQRILAQKALEGL